MRKLFLGLIFVHVAASAAPDGPALPKRVNDPSAMGALVYTQWSAGVMRTAAAAPGCGIRGPEWSSYLLRGLQSEFAAKMAEFRRQSTGTIDADLDDLRAWWSSAVGARVNAYSCAELIKNDRLQVADATYFRLQRASALMR